MLNDNGAEPLGAILNPIAWNIDNFPTSSYSECNFENNIDSVTPPCQFLCEELQNMDTDYLTVFNQNVTISVDEVWDHKVYIDRGVTVTIRGAVLDVTNVDVIFGPCAGIDFVDGATLRSTNSVYRPCDLNNTWRGLKFKKGNVPSNGMINECTFKNAIKAVDFPQSIFLPNKQNSDVRLTNNLFSNCLRGITGHKIIVTRAVSGNTFQVDNDKPVFNSACNNENNIHYGIRATYSEFNEDIAQNDFINNSNDKLVGIDIRFGDQSNISNNNFVNNFNGISISSTDNLNIEDNTFSLTNAGTEVEDQINMSLIGNVRIIHNKFFSARENNGNSLATGSAGLSAVSVMRGDVINIKENEITGYETGIESNNITNSNIGENTIDNAWYYGIYNQNPDNVDVACNVIDMELHNNRNTIGVGTFYTTFSSSTAENYNQIRSNCIYETQTAIHVEGKGQGVASTSPEIINNFLFNYTNFGVDLREVNGANALGTGLSQEASSKNTFQSNNIANGSIDISSIGSSPLVFAWGCSGISSLSANVIPQGNGMFNSTASCSNYIGSVSSKIDTDEICDQLEGLEFSFPSVDFSEAQIEETNFPNVQASTESVGEIKSVKESYLKVYPNPAEDLVTVELNSSTGDQTSIEVYSLDGRLCLKVDNSGNNIKASIDVSALSSGAYVVKLVGEETIIDQTKLIRK